jgi:hypothetical protein|tara:strand:+ start:162 stop:287 length:126 start_codon:yes stop_codon:yes gene_type:complete
MEKIKKLNKELIGFDKFNNFFKLDGNGVWVQISNKELMKLI